jgi:hypothetical protein
MPICRRLIQPAPVYTKLGALSLTSFHLAMMLDESTCFVDPDDIDVVSSEEVGREGDSYPGMVWVAIKVARWIGVIPERRLLAYSQPSEHHFTRAQVGHGLQGLPKSGLWPAHGSSASRTTPSPRELGVLFLARPPPCLALPRPRLPLHPARLRLVLFPARRLMCPVFSLLAMPWAPTCCMKLPT